MWLGHILLTKPPGKEPQNTEVIISDEEPRTLLLLCKHKILITEEDYSCMWEMYLSFVCTSAAAAAAVCFDGS